MAWAPRRSCLSLAAWRRAPTVGGWMALVGDGMATYDMRALNSWQSWRLAQQLWASSPHRCSLPLSDHLIASSLNLPTESPQARSSWPTPTTA